MKKILSVIISLSLMSGVCAPQAFASSAAEIYVSVAGSADASGTADNPVNSIESAMKLAQNYSGQDVNVIFKGGRYELTNTIKFSSSDSAGNGYNITYRPYNDEEVVFTGAKKLLAKDFKPVTDLSVLRKAPQNARGKMLMLKLAEYGLDYSKSDSVRPYLYVDNKLQTTARYPNGELLKATNANGSASFAFSDYDVSKWSSADDAILSGSTLSTYFWRNLSMSASGNIITVNGIVRKNAEFYVENLIEELDAPGEYFVDRSNDILYYYPTSDFGEASVIEITAFLDNAIRMDSCSNVTFDGLTFEKIGGSAFYITGAKNVVIKNCTMDFIQGGDAIHLKGRNSEISNNSFYGCANNVIEIHGGDISTLTEGNIQVKNNRISNCGYYGRHSVIYSGTDATAPPSAYGNVISNNLIQDCMTFMGIVCNANDTKILYNEIVNPGYYIGDGGAIYMGKSNVKYGMEVAYNYIHDGHKGNSAYAYCGLYSDDGYSGNNYHHNVVRDMYQGMIVGVGMNSKFNDNLFINNSTGSYVHSRMTDYTVSGGAVENGYQSMMYNEANTIKQKATYSDKFFAKYPLIDEALTRTPYFAPWNTEVTGNIQIGDGGNISRPWHPYYTKSGAVVIENEDVLIKANPSALKTGKKYIGSNLFTGTYVDELMLYGAKITNTSAADLNGTALGNPSYSYSESYFKNPANQDYSLSSNLSSDVSTAYEIDMSKIGIVSTSDGDMFKQAEKSEAIYPENNSYAESETNFIWKKVRNASKYVITVSENENLSNPVAELTVNDTSLDLAKTVSLQSDTTYYWNIKAYGVAKSDSFETVSDTYSFTTKAVNTDGLEYALSMLDTQLKKYENGDIEYTDSTIYPELKELSENSHDTLSTAETAQEVYECTNEILDAMILYNDSIIYLSAEITECTADKDTDDVYVTAHGFKADSLVSVTVTNPLYNLSAVSGAYNLEGVQYSDTLRADSDGKVEFTFNTRVKNEDRTGIYTVYMAGEAGKVVSKTYCYGIISAGEVVYKNSKNEVIKDLTEYKGQTVSMSCEIWNGTKESFSPAVVNAFYSEGVLQDVQVNDSDTIAPESKLELKWEVKIPESDTAKILFLNSLASLKPFERCRVIYEIK